MRTQNDTSPPWSPGNLRHSSCSSLVLLPSGPDTVRRTTMHRARAPCRARSAPTGSVHPWPGPFCGTVGSGLGEIPVRPTGSDHGGEGGIRTRGGVTPTHAFQACSFGLSDTSPCTLNVKDSGGEEGIRTLGPRERSTVFETAPIDHSGTSPRRAPHSTMIAFVWQRSP